LAYDPSSPRQSRVAAMRRYAAKPSSQIPCFFLPTPSALKGSSLQTNVVLDRAPPNPSLKWEQQRHATRPRVQVRCTFSDLGAWRHTAAVPLSSNVRLRRTCVHLCFEQNLSIWQRVLLSSVGQCASRKSNVSKQWLRQVRPPRFQQQEPRRQHGCRSQAKLSQ
jgi:hypothetical protein